MSVTSAEPCPACGGRSIPLIYGLPGPELLGASARGEMALGGCVRDNETHRCTRCGLEFTEAARRVTEGVVVSGAPGEPRVMLALTEELRRIAPREAEEFVEEYNGLYIRLSESDAALLDYRGADVVTRLVARLIDRLNGRAPAGLAFGERNGGGRYGWWDWWLTRDEPATRSEPPP